jgi:hypothetical protein
MRQRDHQKLIQGLVNVRNKPRCWGSGFLVGGDYIFTAAHCLPRCPDTVACFPGDDLVQVSLRGHKSGTVPKSKATALIAFADPCNDLAILAEWGSGGELMNFDDQGKRWRAFSELTGGLHSLQLRLEDLKPEVPIRCHVFTSGQKWKSGLARIYSPVAPMVVLDFGVPGGTSGSPVVDDAGNVFGVISSSGGSAANSDSMAAYLPNVMPRGFWKRLTR